MALRGGPQEDATNVHVVRARSTPARGPRQAPILCLERQEAHHEEATDTTTGPRPFRHDRRDRRNARDARFEPEHRHTIHMISTRSIGLLVDREPEDWAR